MVFCPGPQRQKFHCWELKGAGGSVRKTHPSGERKRTSPVSRAACRFSPKLSPSHAAFSSPTARHHDPGTHTRRGHREAGQRGFPASREGAARAGIPAWRKRGPAPARGRRRRRAPSVHRPRRRSSAFPQARLKIGASVTPGPSPADLALGSRPPGSPRPRSKAPRQGWGRARGGPARPSDPCSPPAAERRAGARRR